MAVVPYMRTDVKEDRDGAIRLSWALLVLRLIAGIIFMAHGGQLLFGLFGGPGIGPMMQRFGPILGVLVPVGQFFGGLGLIVGILPRFSAAALIVIMIGAIALVHAKNGLFNASNGFEFNLALIGLLVPILLVGPGPFSLHRLLPRKGASANLRRV